MTTDTSTKSTVDYRVLRPDGSEERGSLWFEGCEPTFEVLDAALEPLIGGELERVRVFVDGAYTDMFVDEIGHHKGLAHNEAATQIYWNNMRTHDPETFEATKPHPTIVGPAVLFAKQVWR